MKYLLFFLVFISAIDLTGQADTIIVYDVKNQIVELIPPVFYDSTTTFEGTSFSIGEMGRKVPLDLDPPVLNLLEGTQFTDIARAELFYDVTTYPVRTAVKQFVWRNDTLIHNCSGTLISEKLVLTAAHCLMFQGEWTQDSVLVAPAFDNGVFQQSIPTSTVERYYLFKSFYDNKGWDDIALLELRDPIGIEIGWQGIAFHSDPTFFNENVFHKFSYPVLPNPWDPTRSFNGDTMYYNYGLINFFSHSNREFIGVVNGQKIGAVGKSGSSLFFTDNHEYYSFGVLSFAANYNHYLINRNVFYQFKNIIEKLATGVNENVETATPLLLYPNPASEIVNIEFNNPDNQELTLSVYDMLGRNVRKIEHINGGHFYFHRNGLSSGAYIVRLGNNTSFYETKKIIFK